MKNLGKTRLLNDCKNGLSFCLQSKGYWVKMPSFQKCTRANSKALYFGRRELKLPNTKQLIYTGNELIFLTPDKEVDKKYYIRRSL